MAKTIEMLQYELEYYEGLLDYLVDMVPHLDEAIEQYNEKEEE